MKHLDNEVIALLWERKIYREKAKMNREKTINTCFYCRTKSREILKISGEKQKKSHQHDIPDNAGGGELAGALKNKE